MIENLNSGGRRISLFTHGLGSLLVADHAAGEQPKDLLDGILLDIETALAPTSEVVRTAVESVDTPLGAAIRSAMAVTTEDDYTWLNEVLVVEVADGRAASIVYQHQGGDGTECRRHFVLSALSPASDRSRLTAALARGSDCWEPPEQRIPARRERSQ